MFSVVRDSVYPFICVSVQAITFEMLELETFLSILNDLYNIESQGYLPRVRVKRLKILFYLDLYFMSRSVLDDFLSMYHTLLFSFETISSGNYLPICV